MCSNVFNGHHFSALEVVYSGLPIWSDEETDLHERVDYWDKGPVNKNDLVHEFEYSQPCLQTFFIHMPHFVYRFPLTELDH